MAKWAKYPKHSGVNWIVESDDGGVMSEHIHLIVLMDIREELRKLNALLHCQNFQEIPHVLRGIRRKIPTRRPRRRVAGR